MQGRNLVRTLKGGARDRRSKRIKKAASTGGVRGVGIGVGGK